MAGQINLFNLGALGVDLVNSPLHIPDGAWRQLQNAEFGANQDQGGVKKRGALGLVTASGTTLGGTIMGLLNVPLPIDTTKALLVARNNEDATVSFSTSEDGSTYTELLQSAVVRMLQSPISTALSPFFTWEHVPRLASFNNRLFYPGDDYVRWSDTNFTAPPINTYDGNAAYELFRMPRNPSDPDGECIAITDMLVANGVIYIATLDSGGSTPDPKGRVLSYEPATGTLAEIGNRFGQDSGENAKGFPTCLAWHQGKLWCGTFRASGGGTGGRIWSILPGVDATWTQELYDDDQLDFTGLCSFQGKLYATTICGAGNASEVQVRDSSWSTSLTAPDTGASYFFSPIVFDDELYCLYYHPGNADLLVKRFNGSWATDRDIESADGIGDQPPGQMFVFEDMLYIPIQASSYTAADGLLLERTTGAAYSQVIAADGLRGACGFVRPDAS